MKRDRRIGVPQSFDGKLRQRRNLSEYARIVKDKALKRNLISKLAQLEAEVNSDRGASSEELARPRAKRVLKNGTWQK